MPSAYSVAIDGVRETIVQRSRQYKWLVIGVSVAGAACVLTAIISGSLQPLMAVLALPAAVTGFFALDLRAVQRWRRRVLADWVQGELQLDLLATTLKQVPTLPAQTVAGMLEMLPAWPGEQVPLPARPTLGALQEALACAALRRLVALGIAMGLGAAVVWAALGVGMSKVSVAWPLWLSAGVAVALLWLAGDLTIQWSVLRTCRRAVRSLRPLPGGVAAASAASADDTGDTDDTGAAAAAGWIASLDWQGLPQKLGAEWRSAARP